MWSNSQPRASALLSFGAETSLDIVSGIDWILFSQRGVLNVTLL
jgi:hypothetical protein